MTLEKDTTEKQKEYEIKTYNNTLRIFKLFFVILIIIFSFVLIQFLGTGHKQPKLSSIDLNYTFDDNALSNNNYVFKNLKHHNQISGVYNGTYTFTNETGLTSDDIPYIYQDSSGSNSEPFIENWTDGHSEYIRANKYSGETVNFYHIFPDQDNGTWEAWLRNTDVTYTYQLGFGYNQPSGTFCFAIMIQTDKWQYQDNTGWHDLPITPIDNYWTHVRLDFECTTNGYMGLSQWDYYVYVDYIRYGSFNFVTNQKPDGIRFYTSGGTPTHNIFLDGVGQTWNVSYTIDDNIIPLTTNVSTDLLTNDKYEFDINYYDFPLSYTNDNLGKEYEPTLKDWTIVDSGTNDVYVQNGYALNTSGYNVSIDNNGIVIEAHDFSASEGGIKNDSLHILDLDYQINYTLRFNAIGGYGSQNVLTFYLYSLDNNEVIRWRIFESTDTYGQFWIQSYDGSSWNTWYIFVNDCDNINNTFTFSTIPTVYENDYVYSIKVYKNNVYLFSTTFYSFLSNSTGVSKLRLYAKSTLGGVWIPRIESVSIHNHNIPICYEKGYIKSYSRLETWYCGYQNLIDISNMNYAHTYIYGKHPYFYWTSFSIANKTLNDIFLNTYYVYYDYYENATCYIVNNEYINNSLDCSITGVRLTESTNIYYPSYTYSIDFNVSYYYVIGNTLYWTFFSNESSLEYLRINFDITLLCENYSISYRSDITGSQIVNLRLDYSDATIDLYEIPYYKTTSNIILSQEKTINHLGILITDNTIINGTITGYFKDLTFIYYPNIAVSIVTIDLINTFVLLVILLVPSMAFSSFLGKKTLIPFMIFLSVLMFITNLIPIWSFFILLFCYFILLYLGKETEIIE